MNKCIFCEQSDVLLNNILTSNDTCYVRWDNYPVSKNHLQIVPKRHIESVFQMTEEEILGFYELLRYLGKVIPADGFTIGVNEGEAAGRTIHHVHFHVISREWGDVPNPRGGIRNLFPDVFKYSEWSS